MVRNTAFAVKAKLRVLVGSISLSHIILTPNVSRFLSDRQHISNPTSQQKQNLGLLASDASKLITNIQVREQEGVRELGIK
ncbi:hypothetical protein TNCV_1308851 [Trichonephila clavipes]|nr:hypothetical protein TNCV_1308851 [Trichonephila clavipes]